MRVDRLQEIQIYEYIMLPKATIKKNSIIVDEPILEVVYKNNLELEIYNEIKRCIEENKLFKTINDIIQESVNDSIFEKDLNKLLQIKHKALYEIFEICKGVITNEG